jgi:hypothetical protein
MVREDDIHTATSQIGTRMGWHGNKESTGTSIGI